MPKEIVLACLRHWAQSLEVGDQKTPRRIVHGLKLTADQSMPKETVLSRTASSGPVAQQPSVEGDPAEEYMVSGSVIRSQEPKEIVIVRGFRTYN